LPPISLSGLRDEALHNLLTVLPPRACSQIGARLAPLLGKRANPNDHARAMATFAHLRPELADDPAACEAAVDELWANIGRTFAEFAVSHRMLKNGHVHMDGEERLNDALRSGRPIVTVFPHLGNWEISEMQIGFRVPGRGAVIVAPPKDPTRARIAERIRSRAPAKLLVHSPTVWRQALQILQQPGGVFMLAVDEHAAGRVWAPSFGRVLRTESNLGKAVRLTLRTNAIIVPFHSERVRGSQLLTRILPLVELEGSPRDEAAILEGVRRLDEIMTAPVLRLLDQWYMALKFRPGEP
jgi:lauroyl/myristoyl acyltransferase